MTIQRLNDLTIKQLSNLFTYKFHLLIFLLSLSILTRFNIDPDLGWHLAIGNKFLEHGEIIRGDQFSWTMPGYYWGNSYFGYEILVAFLFKYLGYFLTSLFFGLVASLGILLLIPKKINLLTFLIVGLGAGMATANLAIRPHTISFLLFSALLLFLEKGWYKQRRQIIFWFFYFMLWANIHNAFLIGLLVFASFLVSDLAWRWKTSRKSLRLRLLIILAAFGGTFITPFGTSLWKAILNDAMFSRMYGTVAEFQSSALYFPVNFFLIISAVIFIYIFLKKSREVTPMLLLMGCALFMLGFLAVYFVFFWVAIFIYISLRFLSLSSDLKLGKLARFGFEYIKWAVLASIMLTFLANGLELADIKSVLRADNYPVAAVQFLRTSGSYANLFNNYAWGGYLDWQLPEARVFIDGRMTGWRTPKGGRILDDYLAINAGKCEILAKYDVKTVLINSKLAPACFKDWKKVYSDDIAQVLVKP